MRGESRKFLGFGVVAAFWALYAAANLATSKQAGLEQVSIRFSNGITVAGVPIAVTKSQQAQGLKGRDNVEQGMVFLWPEPHRLYFWMQDTPQPLSIAFFDDEYRVTGIEDMRPFSERPHYSPGPALGAIEMPQGWFAAAGVQPGMTVTLEPYKEP